MQTPMIENNLSLFTKAGVPELQTFTWVDMDKVVDAAARFATDDSLHGRVFGIFPDPHGVVDLVEDEEGGWSGKISTEMARQRREAGDLI
jgi:hypothetical protein